VASIHVCPGIRIHTIDIVQPPGIGIPPISDIDVHHTIIPAVPAAKISAETAKKARCEARSETMRASTLRKMTRSRLLTRNVALVMMLSSIPSDACIF